MEIHELREHLTESIVKMCDPSYIYLVILEFYAFLYLFIVTGRLDVFCLAEMSR